MNRFMILIWTIILGSPVIAGPMGDERLLNSIQALQSAGFSGIRDIQVPQPILLAQAEIDPTKAMLSAYAEQVTAGTISGATGLSEWTARCLGFKPIPGKFDWLTNGNMPIKRHYLKRRTTTEIWSFAVTKVRDKTEIILIYAENEYTMHSYLTSPSGKLEKAVFEKETVAREIPIEDAKAGFQAVLDFWVKYHKTHPQLVSETK